MEEKIETVGNAVKLMLFIYVLAAAVSYCMAWVIKLTYSGVQMQKARAEARSAKAAPEGGNDAPKKAD